MLIVLNLLFPWIISPMVSLRSQKEIHFLVSCFMRQLFFFTNCLIGSFFLQILVLDFFVSLKALTGVPNFWSCHSTWYLHLFVYCFVSECLSNVDNDKDRVDNMHQPGCIHQRDQEVFKGRQDIEDRGHKRQHVKGLRAVDRAIQKQTLRDRTSKPRFIEYFDRIWWYYCRHPHRRCRQQFLSWTSIRYLYRVRCAGGQL